MDSDIIDYNIKHHSGAEMNDSKQQRESYALLTHGDNKESLACSKNTCEHFSVTFILFTVIPNLHANQQIVFPLTQYFSGVISTLVPKCIYEF